MARYTGSVCRLCRRENLKLFLKGDRCYSDKCSFDRRGYPPGQHGQRRGRKVSDYGIQLREKSKQIKSIEEALEAVVRRGVPQWIELEKDNLKGSVKSFPVREDLTMPIQEQLIVELYSK